MVYKPEPVQTEAVSPEELGVEAEPARVRVGAEEYELEQRRTVVGRSRECDIRLTDPNVSRKHAELRNENGAYWVIDLGSTNGLEVNGRRVQRAKLANGDVIAMGSTELTFVA